jgi:ABC-2 type transport system permease protein
MPNKSTGPASSYEVTFPQGILWGLISLVAQFAVSLVRERQQGTMARLRTSPMRFGEILAGEGLACFLACAAVMTAFLTLGAVGFHVRIHSVPLAALAIGATCICLVGMMLFLSTLSKTTQAASGSVWGLLMLCSMFGGGMIPLFMMPEWMQHASMLSPIRWSTVAMEGAIWRGYTPMEMLQPVAVLVVIGAVAFGAGVLVLARSRE